MASAGPEPGWYFDPDGTESERYWNGATWTEHRRSKSQGASALDAEPIVRKTGPTDIEEAPTPSDPDQLQNGYGSGSQGSIAQRWSRLTMKRRIVVVVVPILVLIVVLTVATGLFAPRGPLDRQWAHRSDSYKAGFESGGGYVENVEEQGGSAGSQDEIRSTCDLFASNGQSLRAGVHWSGGIIAHSDFDAEVFRNGCIDGASDARG
jgi:Protein of unknown function (DUF2510)